MDMFVINPNTGEIRVGSTVSTENINEYRVSLPVGFKWQYLHLSRLMGKPAICIGENKGADQLRGNREADQRLCFHYSDSTIPLLLKSRISSF